MDDVFYLILIYKFYSLMYEARLNVNLCNRVREISKAFLWKVYIYTKNFWKIWIGSSKWILLIYHFSYIAYLLAPILAP